MKLLANFLFILVFASCKPRLENESSLKDLKTNDNGKWSYTYAVTSSDGKEYLCHGDCPSEPKLSSSREDRKRACATNLIHGPLEWFRVPDLKVVTDTVIKPQKKLWSTSGTKYIKKIIEIHRDKTRGGVPADIQLETGDQNQQNEGIPDDIVLEGEKQSQNSEKKSEKICLSSQSKNLGGEVAEFTNGLHEYKVGDRVLLRNNGTYQEVKVTGVKSGVKEYYEINGSDVWRRDLFDDNAYGIIVEQDGKLVPGEFYAFKPTNDFDKLEFRNAHKEHDNLETPLWVELLFMTKTNAILRVSKKTSNSYGRHQYLHEHSIMIRSPYTLKNWDFFVKVDRSEAVSGSYNQKLSFDKQNKVSGHCVFFCTGPFGLFRTWKLRPSSRARKCRSGYKCPPAPAGECNSDTDLKRFCVEKEPHEK